MKKLDRGMLYIQMGGGAEFTLLYGRNQYNIVIQLSSQLKIIKHKKLFGHTYNIIKICSGYPLSQWKHWLLSHFRLFATPWTAGVSCHSLWLASQERTQDLERTVTTSVYSLSELWRYFSSILNISQKIKHVNWHIKSLPFPVLPVYCKRHFFVL